ncbi:DUF4174 domain-containing protein [Paracoccus sp. Ld10]|uniref:DUF4174 domain-containing protein n=1 Tax=Paracoccus sp. Ld10 TaxID=649158 RepID=UPI0038634572
MHRLCLFTVLALWPTMAPADSGRGPTPVQTDTLDALRWQARPVVVLGPDAQVARQVADLQSHAQQLTDREVVILTDGPGADALRDGAGFQVLLIGKDGGIKMRSDTPVTAEHILSLIDSMPMRQGETR